MNVSYLWQALRRRAWLVVLTLLVGAAIALWYTLAQAPLYTTEATISIVSTGASADPKAALQVADALAPTLVTYMGTGTFAAQVIQRSELSMTPAQLIAGVHTWHVASTNLIKVRASSHYPQQAELIANGVAETLIAVTNDQIRQQISGQSSGASADQDALLKETQNELQYYSDLASELKTRLADYRSQTASTSRDEGIASLAGQLLAVQQTMNELRQSIIGLTTSRIQAAMPYTVAMVDPASIPVVPVERPLLGNLLASLGISLLVGLVLAFIPESLDYTVHTPEELESTLGINALGAIARIGGREKEDDPIERLVARNYPRSPIAEAFRTLRTNIRFARPDRPRGSLLITSTQPGEGKTLVSANLAVAIAQEGRRAIVVDADLRRPSLHRFFGLPNRLGFTSLIMDENLTVEDVIQDTDVPGLRVITSGPLPPNPLDMLSSKRADQLITQIKGMCDTLVLDSPPVLSVTDPLLLATHVDGALLVAGAKSTRRNLVLKSYQTLKRSGVDVIGAVLNKVRQSDLGYYYSHYYYGYYYGSPNEVPEEIPVVGRMQDKPEKAAEKA
jgi:polysaccharide biosynthesis transport protein